MFEYLLYIFENQICIFIRTWELWIDIILSVVFSQKLDWTHAFDACCVTSAFSESLIRSSEIC